MKFICVTSLLFIALFSFSQNSLKFIGFYYGLNEYFQGTPIINKVKINNSEIYRAQYNVGFNFSKISSNKFYRFDVNYSSGNYWDQFKRDNATLDEPLVMHRGFINVEFTLGKRKELAKNLELLYGLGTNLRIGSELFMMRIIPHEYWTEGMAHTIYRFDPGAHLNAKLNYRFSKRFSVFATLNFSSTLILVDKQSLIMSYERYPYENGSTIKPVRLDLSFRTGASFNIFK